MFLRRDLREATVTCRLPLRSNNRTDSGARWLRQSEVFVGRVEMLLSLSPYNADE